MISQVITAGDKCELSKYLIYIEKVKISFLLIFVLVFARVDMMDKSST